MRPTVLIWILISLIGSSVHAQTGKISGKVVDAKSGEAIPFAHIFLGNTTLGTITDIDGNFLLSNAPAGKSELIASFVGYEPYQSYVSVTDQKTTSLSIKLVPAQSALEGVEVKSARDKEWEKQLRRFTRIFLGNNKAASSCRIINPWVIDFVNPDNSNVLSATASAPIEVQNDALGYNLQFFLKNFQAVAHSYLIDGTAYFREMEDSAKRSGWIKNRGKAYAGSERHLFKSILNNSAHQDGFRLYYDIPGVTNPNTRSDIFYSDLKKKVLEYDGPMVFPSGNPNEYHIRLKGRTEVHYIYGEAQGRLYKDVIGPVSWMEVRGDVIKVNGDGVVLNPSDLTLSGEMSYYRVSTLLPFDYKPNVQLEARVREIIPVIEKVYLHTDKPYYYPGEIIWMKAYMNYNRPAPADSLSQTLYVELINESKDVVKQEVLRLDSGRASGALTLPVTIPPGNYLLRAYTHWMRNFGEDCFYMKPLALLKTDERVTEVVATKSHNSDPIQIVPDKDSYGTREKIQLVIHAKDSNNDPVASHLSISVTDLSQVAAIAEAGTIATGLAIPNVPRPGRFFYPVEHGIRVSGYFEDDQHERKRTPLMVVVGKFEDLLTTETDAMGNFDINGLDFFDSVDVAFQAKNKRGKPYGRVVLNTRQVPPVSVWKKQEGMTIVDAGTYQRSFSDFDAPNDAIQLSEVTVESKRIEEPPKEIEHRMFGKPDYEVKGDVLINSGTTNLVLALQGKVPGLTILQAFDSKGSHYMIRMRGVNTVLGPTEPLLLLDGTPMGGAGPDGDSMGDTSGDRLASLDITSIDRVEVTTRINSLYGLAGKNGVIAIYTKANSMNLSPKYQDVKSFQVFKVPGFDRPRPFRAPVYYDGRGDETKPDYRSTIYWNPEVKTGKETGTGSVTFFSADLPGRYRVVVEGISEGGEPVWGESWITIRND